MGSVKEVIEKNILKIQKTFPKNIDSLYETSLYSRLVVKLEERKEYHYYKQHLQYLRNFEDQFRQIGNPNFVQLKDVTYQMNAYGKYVNLKESCLAPNSLNSRLRFSLEIIKDFFSLSKDIYLTEHETAYHQYLKKTSKFNITTSLFNPAHVLHQDMTALTYPDESFDLSISFEDLGNIPEYKKAVKEFYRVTRKRGNVLLSVPFNIENDKTIVRAASDSKGEISHSPKLESIGNEVMKDEILSFYDFGWELLEEFRLAGFSEANLIIGYDIGKLILETQLFISAVK